MHIHKDCTDIEKELQVYASSRQHLYFAVEKGKFSEVK